MTMKKMLTIILILTVFALSACSASKQAEVEEFETKIEVEAVNSSWQSPSPLLMPLTLEEALEWFTTDIVIAQYVGHRPFGRSLVEFEFVVVDRILGDAADRIFLYTGESSCFTAHGGFTFNHGTDYLLALESIDSAYSKMHIDGFRLVDNIIIDLNSPQNSPLFKSPTIIPSEGLDLISDATMQQILSYIREITKNIVPLENTLIRSDVIGDILHGSPYVLIVEINRVRRLTSDGGCLANKDFKVSKTAPFFSVFSAAAVIY